MKICVFSGGAGTRMWALSRRGKPKEIQPQIRDLQAENMILETEMRDTAAAVGYAVYTLQKKFPGQVMAAIWGADHIIKKDREFIKALKLAEKLVKEKE